MDIALTLREVDHIQGPPSASLLILVYANYQCPKSGQVYQTLKKLRQLLGHRLCLVFRHLPQTDLYPQSQKAAETAEAAGSQGKFWEMHNKLFENQQALDDASLVEYADELGLDVPKFLQELGYHTHAMRIGVDVDSARHHEIKEVPTFFISVRYQDVDNLEAFVHQVLSAAAVDNSQAASR